MVMQHEPEKVVVKVADSGLGIKPEDQGKLFQMFGSIKDEKVNRNGIGLGLVISRMLVEKFNGQINFVSTYTKGTTFTFTFETQECDQVE